jgi:hypothetical protein
MRLGFSVYWFLLLVGMGCKPNFFAVQLIFASRECISALVMASSSNKHSNSRMMTNASSEVLFSASTFLRNLRLSTRKLNSSPGSVLLVHL